MSATLGCEFFYLWLAVFDITRLPSSSSSPASALEIHKTNTIIPSLGSAIARRATTTATAATAAAAEKTSPL